MADTGLLITLAFMDKPYVENELCRAVLFADCLLRTQKMHHIGKGGTLYQINFTLILLMQEGQILCPNFCRMTFSAASQPFLVVSSSRTSPPLPTACLLLARPCSQSPIDSRCCV